MEARRLGRARRRERRASYIADYKEKARRSHDAASVKALRDAEDWEEDTLRKREVWDWVRDSTARLEEESHCFAPHADFRWRTCEF